MAFNAVDTVVDMILVRLVVLFNTSFRAHSGNSNISGYITAPQVGKEAQTMSKVIIEGPIPAIAMSGRKFG